MKERIVRSRLVVVGGLITIAAVAAAYFATRPQIKPEPGTQIAGFSSPDELTLYSINPAPNEAKDIEATPNDTIATGRYTVLGKVPITDPVTRREFVAIVQDAIVNHDGYEAECFIPRHAIVAVEKGKRFEIIICFQCRNFSLDGGQSTSKISTRPQEALNRMLEAAGIPIAP